MWGGGRVILFRFYSAVFAVNVYDRCVNSVGGWVFFFDF